MGTRFDTTLATIVTAMKTQPIAGRTEVIRQLHEDARRAELAWPGSTPLVPAPSGNQALTLGQLNAIARGPNT